MTPAEQLGEERAAFVRRSEVAMTTSRAQRLLEAAPADATDEVLAQVAAEEWPAFSMGRRQVIVTRAKQLRARSASERGRRLAPEDVQLDRPELVAGIGGRVGHELRASQYYVALALELEEMESLVAIQLVHRTVRGGEIIDRRVDLPRRRSE